VLCDTFDTSTSIVSTNVSIPVSERLRYIADSRCHDISMYREMTIPVTIPCSLNHCDVDKCGTLQSENEVTAQQVFVKWVVFARVCFLNGASLVSCWREILFLHSRLQIPLHILIRRVYSRPLCLDDFASLYAPFPFPQILKFWIRQPDRQCCKRSCVGVPFNGIGTARLDLL